jgi:hypothetical protein
VLHVGGCCCPSLSSSFSLPSGSGGFFFSSSRVGVCVGVGVGVVKMELTVPAASHAFLSWTHAEHLGGANCFSLSSSSAALILSSILSSCCGIAGQSDEITPIAMRSFYPTIVCLTFSKTTATIV